MPFTPFSGQSRGASQPDEKCLAPAPYRTLIDRLAAAVRALLDAGPPQLPGSLQIDMTVLLAASGNDATRTLQAAKQESARVGCTNAAEAEGVERGES